MKFCVENPQKLGDLVTFTVETINRKLRFLCSVNTDCALLFFYLQWPEEARNIFQQP